jgi:hypothetical protein
MDSRLFTFAGVADGGPWRVTSAAAVVGEPLPEVGGISVQAGDTAPPGSAWVLRGVTSNDRYASRPERDDLRARQASMGRPQATRGALIPIRKDARWWALTQDERLAIFTASSRHIAVGMAALPQVARRLHHCRDLGAAEPFDFLTFFDFAPEDEPVFDELLRALRATEEWRYVDREVDLRLERVGG